MKDTGASQMRSEKVCILAQTSSEQVKARLGTRRKAGVDKIFDEPGNSSACRGGFCLLTIGTLVKNSVAGAHYLAKNFRVPEKIFWSVCLCFLLLDFVRGPKHPRLTFPTGETVETTVKMDHTFNAQPERSQSADRAQLERSLSAA